jgi:curved DNA-binding protein CbpA
MDPYAVLGLARGASADEAKAAFRAAARAHHPDLHAAAPPAERAAAAARFRAALTAYKAITADERRAAAGGGRGAGAAQAAYADAAYQRHRYQGGGSAYAQHRRRGGVGPGRSLFVAAIVGSGAAWASAALGGVALAALAFLDPLATSLWERRNAGRLFDAVEREALARQRAELAALRAERAADEAAAAAATVEVSVAGAAGDSS